MDGTWIMPALDAVVVAMLASVVWRLRGDPHAEWTCGRRRCACSSVCATIVAARAAGRHAAARPRPRPRCTHERDGYAARRGFEPAAGRRAGDRRASVRRRAWRADHLLFLVRR